MTPEELQEFAALYAGDSDLPGFTAFAKDQTILPGFAAEIEEAMVNVKASDQGEQAIWAETQRLDSLLHYALHYLALHGGASPALRDHATAEAAQEPSTPGAFKRERRDYVLTVCLDGIPQGRDFDAIEETIEATGEAICLREENPTSIVTILLSEDNLV